MNPSADSNMKQAESTLKMMLTLSVPMWVSQYKAMLKDELVKIRDEAVRIFNANPMALMGFISKEGEAATVFNAVAKALAIRSFQPGGITAFDLHFENKHTDWEYPDNDQILSTA